MTCQKTTQCTWLWISSLKPMIWKTTNQDDWQRWKCSLIKKEETPIECYNTFTLKLVGQSLTLFISRYLVTKRVNLLRAVPFKSTWEGGGCHFFNFSVGCGGETIFLYVGWVFFSIGWGVWNKWRSPHAPPLPGNGTALNLLIRRKLSSLD